VFVASTLSRRARRVLLVAAACSVAVACSTESRPSTNAAQRPSGAALVTATRSEVDVAAPRLPDLQRTRLDYLFAAMDRVARHWPWSNRDEICVLLLAPDAQWGLNCNEPPSVRFSRTAESFRGKPVFASRDVRYRIGGRDLSTAELLHSLSAAAHVDEPGAQRSDLPSGQPWLVLGSLEGLRAHHPAFENASTEEWISVALHEFAHARQLRMPDFADRLRAINSGVADPNGLAALYRTDVDYRRLVDSEYAQLVAAAWLQPTAASARDALAAWLERYALRRALLATKPNGGALVEADSVFTYVEGAARFVESQYLVDATQHPSSLPTADPLFRSYVGFLNRGYSGMPNKQMDAEYFYAIGFHLCVLLDRLDPRWKSQVHADPDGVIGRVRAAAASAEPYVSAEP
jgi:hypothetical protein